MTTIIFEPSVNGHHLEYLHHYYVGALDRPDEKFYIVITSEFEQVKDKYVWEKSSNIEFKYIDEKYRNLLSAKNIYILGWNLSKILRDYVKELHPDKVLLPMLMQFIPFICFLLPNNVKVRGIMYKIYLYEQKEMSFMRLMAEKIRFWIAVHSKVIESFLVLNDEDSAKEFNKLYRTKKFRFIPDPVPQVNPSECKDIREELNIPSANTVFLHFGGLSKRKGTLDILYAIQKAKEDDLKDKTFIFAGRINKDLHDEFYSLLKEVKNQAQILVFDEFCSYDFLYNMCYSCDFILMPYQLSCLSSGVIGYGAVFHKPVIGPKGGLVGRLIEKYRLGYTVDIPLSRESLMLDSKEYKTSDSYINTNSVENFNKAIYLY